MFRMYSQNGTHLTLTEGICMLHGNMNMFDPVRFFILTWAALPTQPPLFCIVWLVRSGIWVGYDLYYVFGFWNCRHRKGEGERNLWCTFFCLFFGTLWCLIDRVQGSLFYKISERKRKAWGLNVRWRMNDASRITAAMSFLCWNDWWRSRRKSGVGGL